MCLLPTVDSNNVRWPCLGAAPGRGRQAGFSLLELIVVVVLLGILATGAGLLITRPIESFQDQSRRQQLVDAAEMALRKVAFDVRRALPNSIRVRETGGNWALEMINTVDGARYRDEPGGDYLDTDLQILDFTSPDDDFNILGRFANVSTGNNQAYRVVIYNTNNIEIYNQAAANANSGVITRLGVDISNDDSGPADDEQRVTLAAGLHDFTFQSPGQRMFLVDYPISYVCEAGAGGTGRITRFYQYDYAANQGDIDTSTKLAARANSIAGEIVATVSSCEIDYDPGAPTRGGLLTLDLGLQLDDESVRLLHQVHVDNLP